jgi:hypothetical protein
MAFWGIKHEKHETTIDISLTANYNGITIHTSRLIGDVCSVCLIDFE